MDSPAFGRPTFMMLGHFKFNISTVLRTIEIYGLLPKKLDEGLIKHTFSESQLRVIKQFIILDSLSRVMAAIEATLILFYGLSKGYKNIMKILTRYNLNIVESSINKVKQRKYSMNKIIGLSPIKLLNLSKNEQKVLYERYKKTCDTCYNAAENWIKFYEKYKIIYGKSRHGLTFWPDMKLNNSNTSTQTGESFVVAFDRKSKETMPFETIFSDKAGPFIDWCNTVSILKLSPKLYSDISGIMHDLETMVDYITTNHLLYVQNCGHDYLPSKTVNENEMQSPVFYGDEIVGEEKKILEEITKKILPNMNHNKLVFNFVMNMEGEKLKSSLENTVTNIWYSENPSKS